MNEVSATENGSVNGAAMLAGGKEVVVSYRDGLSGAVLVRDLPVKEYPRLLSAMNDEERQAEIYCDRPAGWAATLTGASLNAVMEAGEALNKDPFFGWFARKQDQMRRLAPGKMEEILKTALEAAKHLPSGLPESR